MSRALGDMEYKKPRVNRLAGHDLSDIPGIQTGVAPGKTVTHDLVSNKAHFTSLTLSGESLIMLASDGVGDAEEALDDARDVVDMWTERGSGKLKSIAHEITKRAGEEVNDADNCTVLLVALDAGRKGERRDSGALDVPLLGSGLRSRKGSEASRSRRSSMSSFKESIKDLIKS